MKNHTCAILAETPMCFAWGFDEEDDVCAALKLLVRNAIFLLQNQGITRFIVPMDAGFGLYAAEAMNDLGETDIELELICYIPYEEQAVKWWPELRDRYYNALEKCAESTLISAAKTPTCEINAMLEAIDQSGTVIAVCAAEEFQDQNFAAAFRYAEKTGRKVTLISPPKLY